MTVRQRGSSWQADLMLAGTRYRPTFDSYEAAITWETKAKLDHKLGKPVEAPGSGGSRLSTMGTLLTHVSRTHWRGTRGERTAFLNASHVVDLLGPARHPASVTTADLQEVCAELVDRGNSNGTVNRKMAAVGKLLTTAVDAGVIDRKIKVPKLKEGVGRTRFLTVEEEDAIVSTLRRRGQSDLADFVVFMCETGVRLGEAQRIKWSDIKNGKLSVWETKADLPRTIPLTKRAQEALGSLRTGKQESPGPFVGLNPNGALRSNLEAVFRLLSLKDVSIHTFRHTCASRLAQSPGVTIQFVQRWLGHKNVTTTMRYAHLAVDSLDHCKTALEELRDDIHK